MKAKMTKSEQNVIDRVKVANDTGQLCGWPVGKTRGVARSWRSGGGRDGQTEIKAERAAFDRMLADGTIIDVPHTAKLGGGYALTGHPILSDVAANVDLQKAADTVETARKGLESAERHLDDKRRFVST